MGLGKYFPRSGCTTLPGGAKPLRGKRAAFRARRKGTWTLSPVQRAGNPAAVSRPPLVKVALRAGLVLEPPDDDDPTVRLDRHPGTLLPKQPGRVHQVHDSAPNPASSAPFVVFRRRYSPWRSTPSGSSPVSAVWHPAHTTEMLTVAVRPLSSVSATVIDCLPRFRRVDFLVKVCTPASAAVKV